MSYALKIVTQLPLTELWNDYGSLNASRGRLLTAEDIRDLLRAARVQFVVADVGKSLRWIPLPERHAFWKEELQPHLAASEQIFLDNFPDGYCYLASEWSSQNKVALLVVCERYH